MKRLRGAGRLVIAVTWLSGLFACRWTGHQTGPAGISADAGPTARASAPSIYDLDLALTDQNGRPRALADLRGRVLVAAMMYTSCTSVCPRVVDDMRGVEQQLSAHDREGVDFVLFSLDPGRDSPSALRQFATDHGLAAGWRLFAAPADGVRELSAVLGVKYQAQDDGQIAHSAMIFVVDREGVVRHRQMGINQDRRALTEALALARR